MNSRKIVYWESLSNLLNPIQAQPTESQQDENDSLCNIYFMKEKNAVNVLCGHAKWCIECANTWFETQIL